MLLWLTLACLASTEDSGKTVPEAPDITLSAPPAFDPLAGAPLTWTVTGEDAEPDLPGQVQGAEGTVVRTSVLPGLGWDGLDDAGNPAGTGSYVLVVGTGRAQRAQPFELVRVGVVAAYAEDDDGVTATREPLYWHQRRHMQDDTLPFSAVDTIDAQGEGGGKVTPLPPVGESLAVPQTDGAEPVAYTYDSRPILTFTLGSESVLGAANLGSVPLHVTAPGWTAVGDAALEDGGTFTLQKDEGLGTTIGVTEESLALEVQATDSAGTAWTVATIEVPWRAYRLLDSPTFEEEGEKYQPWVAAVDPALRALDGVSPERGAVLDALVRWIFEDGGLSYDTQYGASAYTTYVQGDWERANFDMAGFLARKFGVIVNCTDCAGMVVGFGNMLGAEVDYAIIGWSFNLDYILAIGGTEYDHCPFGESGCGFSYHAVATNPVNDLIWDATLALDGDDDPGSSPFEQLLVQSIPADEYLDRLVMAPSRAGYEFVAQGTLQ